MTDIMDRLCEPFDPANVHCKPLTIQGNRALAAWYADARDVMDRLDEVFGIGGWQDHYEMLEGGNVKCVLRVRIGDDWITKEDVGGQSEQPDDGDRVKSAFSDALKRTAVKLGVGRYLYRIARQWHEWDAAKRKFATPPVLPASAMPRYVNVEQIEQLRQLLQQTDRNETSFLDALVYDHFGYTPESIERIPARLFQKALTMLKTHIGRRAKIQAEMKTGLRKETAAPASTAAG